jgi:hypothetical protein
VAQPRELAAVSGKNCRNILCFVTR